MLFNFETQSTFKLNKTINMKNKNHSYRLYQRDDAAEIKKQKMTERYKFIKLIFNQKNKKNER